MASKQPKPLSAGDALDLNVRRFLVGALTECGGAEEFGKLYAQLLLDSESTSNNKITVATNLAKLLGSYGDTPETGGDNEDDIKARLKALDEEYRREGNDGEE